MRKELKILATALLLTGTVLFFSSRGSIQGACRDVADAVVQQAPEQYRENTDLWYKIYVACLKVGPEKAKSLKVEVGSK